MSRIENILKTYADGKQDAFKFYGFISPPETDEQYRWASECGYTHMQFFYAPHKEKNLEKALELAQKYGMKVVWLGENFVNEERPYVQHPCFDGIYVDEPLSIGDLEKLSNELAVFQEKYPGKRFYVNTVKTRGRSWEIYASYFKDHFLKNAKEKFVSGDVYALREPDVNGKTMISFLEDIRNVGQLAADSDSEMYFFVQTIAMHGAGWSHPARRPSTEDIRFLHYVIASCGASGFAHFCYRSPDRSPNEKGEFLEEDYACIHWDGYRTQIWYSAQQVIAEFKKFENIFLKFKWKGIMPVHGAKAETPSENFKDLSKYISAHSYIEEVTSEQDLLIGCFEDGDGNVGLTLVNFSDPYEKKETPITLQLTADEEIAVIKNGETNTVLLKEGCYKTILAPGEGQFLIIPKQKKAEFTESKKENKTPAYLIPPQSYHWKEDFKLGNNVDTYNVYGSGNSHFEFMEEGYPEGGSGRVVRLYSTTRKEKDWSSYKFALPNIPYDENKKLVFKMYCTSSAFTVNLSCDNMVKEYRAVKAATLERYGRWTWFEVPLKDIYHESVPVLSEVTMCIGAGVPYGTSAYLDEILLCDL